MAEQIHDQVECCPTCGNQWIEVLDSPALSKMKGKNMDKCSCSKCGWKGLGHELVDSVKMTEMGITTKNKEVSKEEYPYQIKHITNGCGEVAMFAKPEYGELNPGQLLVAELFIHATGEKVVPLEKPYCHLCGGKFFVYDFNDANRKLRQ